MLLGRGGNRLLIRHSRSFVQRYRNGGNVSRLSSYSSFFESNPTLFTAKDVNDATSVIKPTLGDAELRDNVRTMGSLLGHIIERRQGKDIFDKIEELRRLAKMWREAGAGRGNEVSQEKAASILKELADDVSTLTNSELFWVSRAFTHFLAIANAAEGHHRGRILNQEDELYQGDIHALSHKSDSCGGLLPQLVKNHDKETIYQSIISQQVELVLTAHPTEVNRRTILDKHRRVQSILTKADALQASSRGPTPYEQEQLNKALEREIASIWQSDEVARAKPTPQDEAERGTLVVETVLWSAVPSFLRKLDATMKTHLGKGLPLDAAPIKISSWMGGDRDGNSFVTPNVTREVCWMKRIKAARLFREDLKLLRAELSIGHCSQEMIDIIGPGVREPYRVFLTKMIQKLEKTSLWAEQCLDRVNSGHFSSPVLPDNELYIYQKDLVNDLKLVYDSLCSTGNEITADGRLTDIIRNASAFGLTLVPLDIRQESNRHMEALDCITRYLGLGRYADWDEETKINWLVQQLGSMRPLIRPGDWELHPEIFTPTAIDTLGTFRVITEQHEGSLGAYVISQATSASDVLAVYVLQKDAGVKKPLRVVPLFETLNDLNMATSTMKKLYSLPTFMGIILGRQEIMIGYSDSAKDAGRLAASWAQYETQEKLAALSRQHNVEVTFFHGKGGTVGRGGNPATFQAILAHAPDTINGRFRVTEQGEMINQNFGHGDRAERTLDIYTAAVLAEKLIQRPKPTDEWRAMMTRLSDISCNSYRRIVRGDSRFVPYFRLATPEIELTKLNIGSRPAKRKAGGGVESLRAIPWNFAWTQTRRNLPTWLGVGDAVNEVLASKDKETLRHMYENWGSFRTTIDLVEMVLAKSEPAIAQHYEKVLVNEVEAQELGKEIRDMHLATEEAVLSLTGHETLTEGKRMLTRALQVRNPYVDCLNVLQAETLKRLRESEDGKEDPFLHDALMTSITGIANGMGNTG